MAKKAPLFRKVKPFSNFDPRHKEDRKLNQAALSTLVSAVTASCPTSGLLQFWQDPIVADTALNPQYSQSMAAANLIIPTHGQPITDIDKDSEEIAICDYVEGCTISAEISKEVELHSRGQVDNKLWHDLHVGRITSSAFHDVVVRALQHHQQHFSKDLWATQSLCKLLL